MWSLRRQEPSAFSIPSRGKKSPPNWLRSFHNPVTGAFDPIGKTLTAVDGSVSETIVRVARLACWNDIHASNNSYVCRVRDNSVYEVIEDIPVELISAAYRLRWLIELFFRMFKQLLGCRHLLSTQQNGVEIQTYIAIIACLLILIHTGRTPTKRTYEMICLSMSGWASLEELERHIEKLKAAKK